MPFPLGGDFGRVVSRGFNVVSSDPETDQGDGLVYAGPTASGSSFSASQPPGAEKDHPVHQLLESVSRTKEFYNFSGGTTGSGVLSKVSSNVSSAWTHSVVPLAATSFWRMAQFNPGEYPRLPGVFSDLFVYDVVTSFTSYNSRIIHMIDTLAARIKQAGDPSMSGNVIQTDYYTTVSGQVDPCIGDFEPPFITYIAPTASGLEVRPRDQAIEFSLSDVITGVDISTVFASVNSTTSGTFSLLANGSDQTGGHVNVTGDATSYNFRYVPPFLWDYNDIVTVTISGSDLTPMVGGNPFFCTASGTNSFTGTIPFQVLNETSLPASLTVIGDTVPPYISQAVPASGTTGNSVFDPVVVKVADDLTGVDLSTLIVNVDSNPIVSAGVPSSSETVITGTPTEYTVTYTPTSAFTYGSTTNVAVSAADLVSITAPNSFSSLYDFSFIEDSTLVIENFVPAVGTHHNLDQLDIKVDVRDDTYGVDADQTFFVINGTVTSGTQTLLASGIQLTYHPPNDFNFDEPIRVTVHGTNGNVSAPVVKEAFYTLFYGCRILYFNDDPFPHATNVDVFVRARNVEALHKDLTTGYFFTSYTQPSSDFGASIEAINPQADLPATLTVIGPEHNYGQTVTVEFSVEDFEGNLLGPYIFTYTIENKPD